VFFDTFCNTLKIQTHDKKDLPPIEDVISRAYDGKYYPATVVVSTKYNCENDSIITDFSLYEEKKIVGFTVCATETFKEHLFKGAKKLNKDIEDFKDMDEEELENILNRPIIFKHAVVFSPVEGLWTWESLE
jgi:hypothetical protein